MNEYILFGIISFGLVSITLIGMYMIYNMGMIDKHQEILKKLKRIEEELFKEENKND